MVDALPGRRVLLGMNEGEYRFADDLVGGTRPQQMQCRAVCVVDPDLANDERGVGRGLDQFAVARLARTQGRGLLVDERVQIVL